MKSRYEEATINIDDDDSELRRRASGCHSFTSMLHRLLLLGYIWGGDNKCE